MAKLEKSHFSGLVFLAAGITLVLQFMGKELAVRYDRHTIIVLVQLVAAALSSILIIGYLGFGTFAKNASEIGSKHWGFILLSALLGSVVFMISLRTLMSEKISDHGVLGVGAEVLAGLVGGYMIYSEGVSISRIMAVVVMIFAAWFAVHV